MFPLRQRNAEKSLFVTQCSRLGIQIENGHVDQRFSVILAYVAGKSIVVLAEQQDIFSLNLPSDAGSAENPF